MNIKKAILILLILYAFSSVVFMLFLNKKAQDDYQKNNIIEKDELSSQETQVTKEQSEVEKGLEEEPQEEIPTLDESNSLEDKKIRIDAIESKLLHLNEKKE